MSHHGHHQSPNRTNTWLTPPEILLALGCFDIDPCAAPDMPWPTAKVMLTEEDNGLAAIWQGRAWVNPPYSRPLINRFMERLDRHGHGTALVFARTDTQWARDYVFQGRTATGCLFLHHRLHFHDIHGVRAAKDAGAPSMLVSYGCEDFEALHTSGLNGTLVPLNRTAGIYLFLSQPVRTDSRTWAEIVLEIVESKGGEVLLQDVYDAVEGHQRTKRNQHWKAKVRQVLSETCTRKSPGQFELPLDAHSIARR